MHAFMKSVLFLGCANIVYINSCLLKCMPQKFKVNLLCQLADCSIRVTDCHIRVNQSFLWFRLDTVEAFNCKHYVLVVPDQHISISWLLISVITAHNQFYIATALSNILLYLCWYCAKSQTPVCACVTSPREPLQKFYLHHKCNILCYTC